MEDTHRRTGSCNLRATLEGSPAVTDLSRVPLATRMPSLKCSSNNATSMALLKQSKWINVWFSISNIGSGRAKSSGGGEGGLRFRNRCACVLQPWPHFRKSKHKIYHLSSFCIVIAQINFVNFVKLRLESLKNSFL